MSRPAFRLPPALPVTAVKTYRIIAPLSSHFRPATCEEIDCGAFLNGWQLRIEGLTPEMLHTATHCGRQFLRFEAAEGETYLIFPPGQRCFQASQHFMPNGAPERFIERDGDWRGNPTGRLIVHSVSGWTDSFGEHQERVKEQVERG